MLKAGEDIPASAISVRLNQRRFSAGGKTLKNLLMATALCIFATPALAETRVAVSMTSFDNPFLTILLNGIRAEAGRDKNIELLVEDAQLDPSKQLNQVQNFIANGVDAIIVNAVDGDATSAITKAASAAKIPLVYVNHPPAELETGLPDGTAFVGSNELDSGTMEAEAACKLMGGKGKAVILMGPLENHAALVRTKDVETVLPGRNARSKSSKSRRRTGAGRRRRTSFPPG